jgi:two-component system nitrogen regulation sensor histidine kinase GlnL
LLFVDRDQLVQAFLNVIRNAVQAVKDGGDITLRTRAERQLTLSGRRHRLAVRVDIIDNGPGIPPDIADKIFYPLVSGRPDGTGLGLSITRTLVQRQGGMIACDSRPGRTAFSIWLPVGNHDEVK